MNAGVANPGAGMTDSGPPNARVQHLTPAAVRSGLGLLAAVGLAAALSGCGASTALGNAVLAPLSALPETDVALETNLQLAVEGGAVQAGISGISGEAGAGVPEVSGPPTAAGVVSVASATGVSVYTAFNPVDHHCLGTLVLQAGSTAVLAESSPGSYDFWFGPTTATACTASLFTTQSQVPPGWAKNDPSTGWPLP